MPYRAICDRTIERDIFSRNVSGDLKARGQCDIRKESRTAQKPQQGVAVYLLCVSLLCRPQRSCRPAQALATNDGSVLIELRGSR